MTYWFIAHHWSTFGTCILYFNRAPVLFKAPEMLLQVAYLGHIVAAGTVAPNPTKVKAITDWPSPTTIKGLRGFLGLSEFYRKFIHKYPAIEAQGILSGRMKRSDH